MSGVWIEGCFPSATSNIPVFVSQRTGSVTFEAKKRRYGETKHRFRRCYTFEKPQCNHTLIICLQKQEERLKIKFIMVVASQLQVFSGHSFCFFFCSLVMPSSLWSFKSFYIPHSSTEFCAQGGSSVVPS